MSAQTYVPAGPMPRSLVWATSIDVLPPDRVVERRAGRWIVGVPSNPEFWWGNLLIFDDPPAAGDGERWEQLFAEDFASGPQVRHVTLAWDRVDGAAGEAESEFLARGYELEWTVGCLAGAHELHRHRRENAEVRTTALKPTGDTALWEQVIEVWVGTRPDGIAEDEHRTFSRRRLAGLRELFAPGGRGAWYVALDGEQVVASCGIVVTGGRARYQAVDTVASHRRRGICSRLLIDAAEHAAAHHRIGSFVIAADPAYDALGIYESLGFCARERVCGVVRRPGAA